MIYSDFEYAGFLLSDFGYIMCSFDGGSQETISNGSNITFNTSPILHGSKYVLTSTSYEECLSTTFQICKNPCNVSDQADMEIDNEELSLLMRWLNRKEFHELRFIEEGYENIYFEGSFNISKIMLGGKLMGLELNLVTNRPYGLYEPVKRLFNITEANQTISFKDISDEMGYIYPTEFEVTCNAAGDLMIYNEMEKRETTIKNCIAGEVIKMNYPVISSSVTEHKIQNDFNYNFFRIANEYNDKTNRITFSMPCSVKFVYQPVKKVGV